MLPATSTALHQLTTTVLVVIGAMVFAGVVGTFAARRFGGNSRMRRELIFSLCTLAGLLIGGTVAMARLTN